MKVSIITVCFNSAKTIEETMRSIESQSYEPIEHLIIDGGSDDGTVDIIKRVRKREGFFLSEQDHGIYDAMNKGLKLASGEIIGFLNSDDIYANSTVIERVVGTLQSHQVDSCYGDLNFVSKENPKQIVRAWKSAPFEKGKFRKGWMPPHPTFFVKKVIYDKYGHFNTHLKIAADYEIMLRFLEKNSISSTYIPQVLINMKPGGKSNANLWNILVNNYESYQAWKLNNLSISPLIAFLKPLSKIRQFF